MLPLKVHINTLIHPVAVYALWNRINSNKLLWETNRGGHLLLDIKVFWKNILCWKDTILIFIEMRCLKAIALKSLNALGKLLIDSGRLKVSILLWWRWSYSQLQKPWFPTEAICLLGWWKNQGCSKIFCLPLDSSLKWHIPTKYFELNKSEFLDRTFLSIASSMFQK